MGKYYTAEAFIKDVIAGKRDFTAIRMYRAILSVGSDEHELSYREFNRKLKRGKEKLILYHADLRKLYARNISLGGAKLNNAYLVDAYLCKADLREADVSGTNFGGATLNLADLRGIKNIDKAKNIGHAIFCKTKADEVTKNIINEAKEKMYAETIEKELKERWAK